MRLYRLRDEVRQELTLLLTDQTLDDGLLDHGLSQALLDLAKHLPERRTILTLTTTGQVQNFATLAPDIYAINQAYYPYQATDPLHKNCYPVTVYAPNRVEFYYCEPQTNEQVEVTYQAIYTILDLNGSTTDTLPANSEHAVILAACAHVLQMLDIRRRINHLDPKTMPPSLIPLADQFKTRAIDEAIALTPTPHISAWPYIGLET